MSELRLRKLTAWPPATLEANTIYAVSISATETEMYITSAGPTVTARKLVDRNSAISITPENNVLIGTTDELTGGGRLQVNGAVNASAFFSEEYTFTNVNGATFINIKTYNVSDVKNFIVSITCEPAEPMGLWAVNKGYRQSTDQAFNTVNPLSTQQVTLSWSGSTLRFNLGSGYNNQNVTVRILNII